ncbi:MAG TPA: IclR family transcriptional regulator [Acidimicrobiales bacterium]|nr:IclR family transcriptional regulator [Acidimicrobiales bacterium]
MPVGEMTKPSGARAIDRAADLLTRVVDAPGSVTFTELAESTGLAKSTTSRLLTALERNGLLRREAGGAFVPGAAFVRYAQRAQPDADLLSVAGPHLERLAGATGETINLGVVRAGQVEQIAQVDSRHVLGLTNWLGRAEPLHATALGKALLFSGAAEPPAGRLARLTASTITSRTALAKDLAAARVRGWALADGELEPGLVAVAAPVRRADGTAIAALSASGPDSRLRGARVRTVGAACVAEARSLSAALGYRGEGER